MPEHLLLRAPAIYCWRGRTMGRTIFRVRKGTLVLTDLRLVYAAAGGTDVWWQLGWAGLGLVPGVVGNAASLIDAGRTVLGWFDAPLDRPEGERFRLGAPDLLGDGRLVVPLPALEDYGVVVRTWSSYLWIAFTVEGVRREYAFSDKVRIPGDDVWGRTITEARAALSAR